MTRITNTIAEKIAKAVTEHAFAERLADARQRLADAGMAAYRAYYGDETIEKMASLPEGWLPQVSCLYFHVNGCRYVAILSQFVPLTYRDSSGYIALNGDTAEAMALQHAEHDFDRQKLERDEALREAERAIKRFGSVKALIKGWPEIEPFAREFLGAFPALPAVIPADLNARLGLPVSEEEHTK